MIFNLKITNYVNINKETNLTEYWTYIVSSQKSAIHKLSNLFVNWFYSLLKINISDIQPAYKSKLSTLRQYQLFVSVMSIIQKLLGHDFSFICDLHNLLYYYKLSSLTCFKLCSLIETDC